MKRIIFSFILGMLLGGGIISLMLNKSSYTRKTFSVTSSDPKARIQDKKLTVQKKYKAIKMTASFKTDRAGVYTNELFMDRRDFQYDNALYISGGYWSNTRMPYLGFSYSYRLLIISIHVGYSFRQNQVDYGIGVGTVWRF